MSQAPEPQKGFRDAILRAKVVTDNIPSNGARSIACQVIQDICTGWEPVLMCGERLQLEDTRRIFQGKYQMNHKEAERRDIVDANFRVQVTVESPRAHRARHSKLARPRHRHASALSRHGMFGIVKIAKRKLHSKTEILLFLTDT